jgi:hypothetical protein
MDTEGHLMKIILLSLLFISCSETEFSSNELPKKKTQTPPQSTDQFRNSDPFEKTSRGDGLSTTGGEITVTTRRCDVDPLEDKDATLTVLQPRTVVTENCGIDISVQGYNGSGVFHGQKEAEILCLLKHYASAVITKESEFSSPNNNSIVKWTEKENSEQLLKGDFVRLPAQDNNHKTKHLTCTGLIAPECRKKIECNR